ncbi:uncharacterized protein N7498_000200 [Penicillium cinerascens]|uniref:Glucose-methanol-choline oxidoreductase N-terminal domain-containing protein n=1 Tax=Penicillium cinerascens TaxID=70096 RepID=A0A9W9NDX8_9EURO|nr:uncharacterized protein N7498_000200 [Penicillium cinerascens]KAJ5218101.1 hypothetical protein N7498_000200 [Penicillium cinerascens]
MARRHRNPLHDPLHYATPQPASGPPVTYASASRLLCGYDYVIVGAGAAGCVLASKLSEDANVSVLLLEAGGDNTSILETKVPLMFPKLFHTEHDWNYYTVEQPSLAYRKLYWPRGRVLGGSTSLNAMMYHHCSKSDFDEWATDYGCDGWSYNDLAPFFRRMEKFTPNLTRPAIDVKHRGSTGDWHTGYSWLSEIMDKGFLPACQDAGIPLSADVNTSDGSLGVTRFQTFIDSKGQRSSLATAFLTPDVLQRPNLYVACHSHVTRILFDRLTTNQPTAIGVEFQTKQKGILFEVHARKEVILSAGSINTPQTLLLSGIGPKVELERHGIPILQENDAVGRNLKDHLCPTGIICKAKPNTTLDYLSNTFKALPALLQWMTLGRGPLTSNIAEAAAFLRSADFTFPQSSGSLTDYGSGSIGPDLEIIGAPLAFIHHGEERPPDESDAFSIIPIILRPQSNGTITLRNKDPFEPPIIDPKYLSDKDNNDLNVLLTGLRICLKIVRSPALQSYLEPVPVNDDPTSAWWPYSSSNVEAISDKDLIRFMQEKAFTLYHPVGTARMGSDPKTSAVDLNCRVHNVKGLRVMDASVFPEQVSGHPTAPIGALAYKLSDMIKQDRRADAPLSANL